MKPLLLTAFLSCILLAVKAQHSKKMENNQQDSLAITQALENYYFKGIYEGDVTTLGNKSYHDWHAAWLFLQKPPLSHP